MKGKRIFTPFESNQIKNIIKQKVLAPRDKQKRIRDKMRSLSFYISDFTNQKGFTVQDYDDLVRKGEIVISDRVDVEHLTQKKKENLLLLSIKKDTIKNDYKLEKVLFSDDNCSGIKDLNLNVLNTTGFYCIRLKPNSRLPNRYQRILDQRKYKYIYIGKTEGQLLKDRLAQELELKRPGTFFRSIGAVLGHLPIKGHLKGKSNQNNYKFSNCDKCVIIKWLRDNVEVSVATYEGDFDIENELIKKYCPLLNDTHNPMRLVELREDKARCRKFARGD
ncbi:MAG: hypothetical protein PHO39_10475 [Fermentimonas sp.]|nr:hypothetical protein [Fermentimonas sp.]